MIDKPYYPEDIRAKHRCSSCEVLRTRIDELETERDGLKIEADVNLKGWEGASKCVRQLEAENKRKDASYERLEEDWKAVIKGQELLSARIKQLEAEAKGQWQEIERLDNTDFVKACRSLIKKNVHLQKRIAKLRETLNKCRQRPDSVLSIVKDIIPICTKCCGRGELSAGGHSNECFDCDGKGFFEQALSEDKE